MNDKPADPLEERRRYLRDRVYVSPANGYIHKTELTAEEAELRARRDWLNRMSSAFWSKVPMLDRWSEKQWLRFLREHRDAIDALIVAEGRIRARGPDRPLQR